MMAAARNDPKAFADWYVQDYYRRPRPLRRAKVWLSLTAAIVSLFVVAGTIFPGNHRAYQAGPLANPHVPFNSNCQVCHTGTSAFAIRFLPSHRDALATPDAACLTCHESGAHNPHQLRHTGADHLAAECAVCHWEHHGIIPLTRISDAHCTRCHNALATDDDKHRFATQIRHFDLDHPAFGAWREKLGQPLADPGTIRFNHSAHLQLAVNLKGVPAERLGGMAEHVKHLGEQSCVYCHQPDIERRYILPVRYDNHCAGCHPLTSRPAGDWPESVVDEWIKYPLPHPARGETAARIRGALLERYYSLLAPRAAAGAPVPSPARPSVLAPTEREHARQLAGQTEARVFAPDAGEIATQLEKPFFVLKSGCAYCHRETSAPETRKDGLPEYAFPHLRERWRGIIEFPDERFGPTNAALRSDAEQASRDRWFPYARFSHERHRELDCIACHKYALTSKDTADLLLPDIADCRQCHNRTTAGARSDCLDCHTYHDRTQVTRGMRGRWTIDDILDKMQKKPDASGVPRQH